MTFRGGLIMRLVAGGSLLLLACSGEFHAEGRPADAGPDARASSGGRSAGSGGTAAAGGRTASGGGPASGGSSGGRGTGGGPAAGGAASGGATSAGGQPASGGAGTGGIGTGGSSTRCEPACGIGLACCNGRCINPDNDILNCGGCEHRCSGPAPYCGGGTCIDAPCSGVACPSAQTCCGNECCTQGTLCCTVNIGPGITRCTDPVEGTCPVGCPGCVCASPDTPITTPHGEVPIASLRVGDLVLSVDDGELRMVPIRLVHRERVASHQMVRLTLPEGRTLEMSPGHPTADGRTLADLAEGDTLGGLRVLEREVVPYAHPFTYDILPDSDSGTYFASGALVGSTLTNKSVTAERATPPLTRP